MGNTNITHDPDDDRPTLDDILAPVFDHDDVACGEDFDLLALSDDQLLSFARDLQGDLHTVRFLLHEALTMLHRANVQREYSQARIRALLSELRIVRAECRTLAAEVRQQGEAA